MEVLDDRPKEIEETEIRHIRVRSAWLVGLAPKEDKGFWNLNIRHTYVPEC